MATDTLPLLHSLLTTHPDLEHVSRSIWAAWERDEIGSPQCRQLLSELRARRVREAEERRRLADEFERTAPAPEGVEAPDHGDAWEG